MLRAEPAEISLYSGVANDAKIVHSTFYIYGATGPRCLGDHGQPAGSGAGTNLKVGGLLGLNSRRNFFYRAPTF